MKRRAAARLLFMAAAAICAGLMVNAERARYHRDLPAVSLEPAAISGFHTTLYRGEHLRLRISADSVVVTHPKVFGPFSLGFVRSVVARNVTLETYPGENEQTSLEGSLRDLPEALSQQHGTEIAAAELTPVQIIAHRRGEGPVVLTAASCAVRLSSTALLCHDGILDEGGRLVRFRELSHDGKTLHTAAEGDR